MRSGPAWLLCSLMCQCVLWLGPSALGRPLVPGCVADCRQMERNMGSLKALNSSLVKIRAELETSWKNEEPLSYLNLTISVTSQNKVFSALSNYHSLSMWLLQSQQTSWSVPVGERADLEELSNRLNDVIFRYRHMNLSCSLQLREESTRWLCPRCHTYYNISMCWWRLVASLLTLVPDMKTEFGAWLSAHCSRPSPQPRSAQEDTRGTRTAPPLDRQRGR